MPTDVYEYNPYRAIQGVRRTLQGINQAAGYNTTPRLLDRVVLVDKAPAGDSPALAFEMGDMVPAQESYGGEDLGLVYLDWPALIWGYVTSSEDQLALYRAGTALLADVQSAFYADETMKDGAGQGVVLFAHPGQITFDMESFSSINRGYFVAEFRLTVSVTRGANP